MFNDVIDNETSEYIITQFPDLMLNISMKQPLMTNYEDTPVM